MHIYECQDGTKVPSVTTILKVLGNESITKWANYLGFKHIDYERELNRYADRGTSLHTCLQHVVDPSLWGDDHPITFNSIEDERFCEGAVKKFNDVMEDYPYTTIFTERTFISKTLGYGGTLDWYAEMSGKKMINDFKSSKQVRMKHLIQIGGYKNLLEEEGYQVDGGSIIITNPMVCKLYPVDKKTLDILGDLFNRIKFVYDQIEGPLPQLDTDLLSAIKKGS